MARCLVCNYPIPEDRERVGARCPSCHDPLYEPPGRVARPPREDEPPCAAHPGMGSVGLCARCARPLCETCRTRWRGQILCAACVDRALASSEATPEQAQAAARQARRGAGLALLAWLIALAALAAYHRLARPGDPSAVVVTFLAFGALAADAGLAAFALGQAVAALRLPGAPRALPLAGLAAAGLVAAVLLGVGLAGLW